MPSAVEPLPAASTYSQIDMDTALGRTSTSNTRTCASPRRTSAVSSDPKTGFILNHDNDNKRDFNGEQYRCNEYYKKYEQVKGLFSKAHYAPNRTCRPVAIDKVRSGNDFNMDSTNPEGRAAYDDTTAPSEASQPLGTTRPRRTTTFPASVAGEYVG